MTEFRFWVLIVTLLIFAIMALSLMIIHIEKRINKADAIVQRLEEKEKKREAPRTEPKPTGTDGGM